MRVFVTGATGWVGNVVVDDLLGAGHQVLGLSRSKEKAGALAAKGAAVLHGTLDDLDQLAAAVGDADVQQHMFGQALARRASLGLPPVALDEAYLEGMRVAPAVFGAGMALGFDRLVMLLTDQPRIATVLALGWDVV